MAETKAFILFGFCDNIQKISIFLLKMLKMIFANNFMLKNVEYYHIIYYNKLT